MIMMPRLSSGRTPAACLAFFAVVSCIVIQFTQVVNAAYIVSVPAKDEQCYIVASPGAAGGTLVGNFDHLDDNLNSEPLSVVILDAKEDHVLFRSRRRASEGNFRVNLKPDQKVSICLQNGLVTAGRGRKVPSARSHDMQTRAVGFEYSVEVKDENTEIHTQHDRNIKAAEELHRSLLNLINHHVYMRAREGVHREVVETTFGNLMWWVILEAVFVIGIAVGQIMYFRNFLERRRYM
mmetsp:Transcript_34675/g.81778  ORF Transcript_34675/g.81778 Transcript_34675/m.81778 type:complete len:237 (+) Transcript_34675:221-931(+)